MDCYIVIGTEIKKIFLMSLKATFSYIFGLHILCFKV